MLAYFDNQPRCVPEGRFTLAVSKRNSLTAGNYKRRLYNRSIEVMACLDSMEKDLHEKKAEHKEDAFQSVENHCQTRHGTAARPAVRGSCDIKRVSQMVCVQHDGADVKFPFSIREFQGDLFEKMYIRTFSSCPTASVQAG